MAKGKSRIKRWEEACTIAQQSVETLKELAGNYESEEDGDKEVLDPDKTTWEKACNDGEAAGADLADLKSEYEEWLGNLPENLQSSALGEKLQAVVDCDVDTIQSAFDEMSGYQLVSELKDADLSDLENSISEAEALDMPRGFGKD